MAAKSAGLWWGLAGLVLAAVLIVPALVRDDGDGDGGFDGYVQSGTCAQPSGELKVELQGAEGGNDVEPYVATGADGESTTLGQYGAPGIEGFSVAAVSTDQRFSMVITDPDDDDGAVACGDILRPEADRFRGAGVALVQLLPVGSSGVQGVATLERARLERELDVTPARARILLSTEDVSLPSEPRAGYEGDVQGGLCDSPTDDVRIASESDDEFDVTPFEARSPASDEPVTVAYYGRAGVPGFGLAAAYTEQDFSVLITEPESDEPVACGDVLEPQDDEFTDAGLALVQLLPTGDGDVQGYAVLQRVGMQRELDVTPTVISMVLFAPATDT